MRKIRMLCGVMLGLTACMGSRLQFAPTRAHFTRPALAPSQVEVFTAARPTRSFEDVGLIEGVGYGDPLPRVLAKIRRYAAELGCDGIVLLGSNDEVGSTLGGEVYTNKGNRASCIVFTTPSRGADNSRVPAPPAVGTPDPLAAPPPRFDTSDSRPWYKAPALWLGVLGLLVTGVSTALIVSSRPTTPPFPTLR